MNCCNKVAGIDASFVREVHVTTYKRHIGDEAAKTRRGDGPLVRLILLTLYR